MPTEQPGPVLHIGQAGENLMQWLGELGACSLPAPQAFERIRRVACAALLVSCDDPELDAGLAIESALRLDDSLPVLALGERLDARLAVRLGQLGAADYLIVDQAALSRPGPLLERVARAVEDRAPVLRPSGADPFDQLVGASRAMQRLKDVLRLIAPRQSTVLIHGRTGVGKELAARAIHQASPRAEREMVIVNCGAIPANLMEAELFGHVRGAFTGAVGSRVGRFEQAHRSTLFLDEIGELPLEMQPKLLRALQDREFQRVGGSETTRVDVRVVAATNRDLAKMVERGEFREDLYYRLNVVPVTLPSLAERIEDIPAIAARLVAKICSREGLDPKRLSGEALDRLMRYDWPGNVRQLENAIEKAVALSGERQTLRPSDFPMTAAPLAGADDGPRMTVPEAGIDFDAAVASFELGLLRQALERAQGNKKKAAELLRMKRTTFAARWKTIQEATAHV